jgi:hypothetical protein
MDDLSISTTSTESIRSILLRQGSESSTASTNSSTIQLRFYLPPHPRETLSSLEDPYCRTKGDGPTMVSYSIISRRTLIGGLLDKINLGGFSSDMNSLSPIPAATGESSTHRHRSRDSRLKRSESRRFRDAKDVYSEPFMPDDPIPDGMKPLDYRMEQIQNKLDWLFIKQAATPPPAKPQTPKMTFADMVQRDIYDKGMHKPLIGRMCAEQSQCSECAHTRTRARAHARSL